METKFIYHQQLEYERIVFLFSNLATSLYQDGGFLVLPYPVLGHHKVVYLPKIPNFKARKFLPDLRNLEKFDFPYQKGLADNVLKAIRTSGFLPESPNSSRIKKVEAHWRFIEPQFEDYFLDVFPRFRLYRIETEVYWTHYGTTVSFSESLEKGKSVLIRIWLRDDMEIEQIAEGFLSCLLLGKMKSARYQYSWLQKEAIIDFLLLDTKLSRLLPDFFPTLNPPTSGPKTKQYYQDSIRYLTELGFAIKQVISLQNNQLLIGNQSPRYKFTPTEEIILKRLINTPNDPVSYYDLGDLIWKEEVDKFSLWALSRTVFKIRNKLRKNGLDPEYIKNLRGQGYYYTHQP